LIITDVHASNCAVGVSIGSRGGDRVVQAKLEDVTVESFDVTGILVGTQGVADIAGNVVAGGSATWIGAGVTVSGGGKLHINGALSVANVATGILTERGGSVFVNSEAAGAVTVSSFAATGVRLTSTGKMFPANGNVLAGTVNIQCPAAAEVQRSASVRAVEVTHGGYLYGVGILVSGDCDDGVSASSNGGMSLRNYKDTSAIAGHSISLERGSVGQVMGYCVATVGKETVAATNSELYADGQGTCNAHA
jgi:hypothetical protein